MELEQKWKRILKIQEDLDLLVEDIRYHLNKNQLLRQEWYSRQKDFEKNKNNFTTKANKNSNN